MFASNGHQYGEFDTFTSLQAGPFPFSDFPNHPDLSARYAKDTGINLSAPEAAMLFMADSPAYPQTRYYQDAAIRAAFEKIINCRQNGDPAHVLLALATGSGKTVVAANLLWRLHEAELLPKPALFLCDRDELREQAFTRLKAVFGDNAIERFNAVVFFRYLQSPIKFYQMLGRGSRIHEETDKYKFWLYDYTGVTDLFGTDFITRPNRPKPETPGGGGEGGEDGGWGDPEPEEPLPVALIKGQYVSVTPQGRFILQNREGRDVPVPVDEYRKDMIQRVLREAHNLDQFRGLWIETQRRGKLIEHLLGDNLVPELLRELDDNGALFRRVETNHQAHKSYNLPLKNENLKIPLTILVDKTKKIFLNVNITQPMHFKINIKLKGGSHGTFWSTFKSRA